MMQLRWSGLNVRPDLTAATWQEEELERAAYRHLAFSGINEG